jgi:hypothetical protein
LSKALALRSKEASSKFHFGEAFSGSLTAIAIGSGDMMPGEHRGGGEDRLSFRVSITIEG